MIAEGFSPIEAVVVSGIVDSETAPDVISLRGGMPVPASVVADDAADVVPDPETALVDDAPVEAALVEVAEEEVVVEAWRFIMRAWLWTFEADARATRVARKTKDFMGSIAIAVAIRGYC